jgi:hypothetical protein
VSEDGVAPVIAAMLLLAIGVTFFAAWNAYYVPSMKEQSEIAHIQTVESAFLRFSSDIETAVSLKRSMRLSEQVSLGGGDFTFDPGKSGGELAVWNMSPPVIFSMNWTNATMPDQVSWEYNASMARFSYMPVNNFWQEQGYIWSLGNVFVNNSERNLITPLEYDTMDDVTYEGLARSLVGLEPAAYSATGDCNVVIVRVVNITPNHRHSRVSGNGNGLLVLESNVSSETFIKATSLNLSVTAPAGRFRAAFRDYLADSVNNTCATCPNVYRINPPGAGDIQLAFNPNVTLIRETTGITIGVF